MSVLHAWLEYTDDQGFARRLKVEEDVNYLKKALGGAVLLREGTSFEITQNGAKVAILVNGRATRKKRLNNLDLIQIGPRRFIFHASYLPNAPKTGEAAPGPVKIHTPPGKSTPLFPWDMIFLPSRFWRKALNQTAFSVKGTLLFVAIGAGAIALFPRWEFAVASALAAITAYMSGSVIMGFKGILRFNIYCLPWTLLAQGLFLRTFAHSGKGDLVKGGYFLQGALVAGAIGLFFTWQSRMAFQNSWPRCVLFGTTVGLPWYSLMTGVFYFLL
jgi:hypothetical protein